MHTYRPFIGRYYATSNQKTFLLMCIHEVTTVKNSFNGMYGMLLTNNHRVIDLDIDGVYYNYAKL